MPASKAWRSILMRMGQQLRAAAAGMLLLVLSTVAQAQLDLTESERRWLAAHPVIRIGVDPGYAPYAFLDADGQFSGVAADFSARVSALLGVRFEVVRGLTWPQILDAARARTVDVITTAAWRPEREDYLAFSRIYIPTPLVIMTRKETQRVLTPRALFGRRVALVRDYSSSAEVVERVPGILPSYVETPLEGLIQLSTREADAYIGALGVNTHVATTHGLSNLKVNAGFDMTVGQRFAVRRDWPQLAALIDKALAVIPEAEQHAIFRKWIPIAIEDIPVATTELTAIERQFAAENPVLRVGIGPEWGGFVRRRTDGTTEGIAVEFLIRAASHTGFAPEWYVFESIHEVEQALLDGRVDAIAAHVSTSHVEESLLTTEPYFASPLVIIQQNDAPQLLTWSHLAGRKVAMRKNGFADLALPDPAGATPVRYRTLPEALSALTDRKVDAVIANILESSALIASEKFGALRVSERISGADAELKIAVRGDDVRRRAILDKGLASISDADRAEILHRWIGIERPRGLDPAAVGAWFALIVFISFIGVALFTRRNRELTKTVEQRTSELSDSEERFRVIVEQAAIGIATISAEGRWLLVNDRLCDIVGYARDELLQQTFQSITHPDDLPADMLAVDNLLSGRANTYFSEKRYIRKDGHAIWIDLTVAVVRHSPDNKPYFVVIVQDIDARKHAETQVQQLAESLEQRVAERTQQLAAANRELESFSYSVSHDLKAPLRGIDGYSALLEDSLGERLDGEARQFLTNIRSGVKQMNTLIEDLLAYSRMERRTMIVGELKLTELVAAVLGEFRHAIDERGIVVRLDLAENIAHGDRSGLLLVLRNLIGNAIKFTAKSAKPQIRIETDTIGDMVQIRITDNGIGFDPQFHERIFEIFQRLNLAEDFEGTGIGLAIARKAIQRMGGEIKADGRPGAGATFTVQLPKRAVSAPAETSD